MGRVAFITLMEGMPWGGSEALWYNTAKYAKEQGNDVLVSVYNWETPNRYIEELKKLGCVIHYRPLYSKNKTGVRKIVYSTKNKIFGEQRFYSGISDFKPNVVVISQGGAFDLVTHHKHLYQMLEKHQVAYYLICHSHPQFSAIPTQDIYNFAREVFLNSRRVFFVSDRMKVCIERLIIQKLKNSSITWNPLNLKSYNYVEWPKTSVVSFATVSSLVDGKGHDMLFEALSSDKWARRDWLLNIYGSGNSLDYLKKLATYYKLNKKVIFWGHSDDIRTIWMNNHALLIPSSGEGLPITLLEAMICGRFAIVTDVGGISEVVSEGVNGFIAESPHSLYIERALDRAWNKKADWKKLGVRARNFVLNTVDLNPECSLYNIIINNA